MNTISEIICFDTCKTETQNSEITLVVPRTQPVISSAFIESARREELSEDILRQRVIDLLRRNKGISYTKLQIYDICSKNQPSCGERFKMVQSIIEDLQKADLVTAFSNGYVVEYTLSEICQSAIKEIRERPEIKQEMVSWIPTRWR